MWVIFAELALLKAVASKGETDFQRFLILPALLDSNPVLLRLNALLPLLSQLEDFCDHHLIPRGPCQVLQESIEQVVDLYGFCKQEQAAKLPAFVMVKNIASRSDSLPRSFQWTSDTSLNIATGLCNIYEENQLINHDDKHAYNCIVELEQVLDRTFAWIGELDPCAIGVSSAPSIRAGYRKPEIIPNPESFRVKEIVPDDSQTDETGDQELYDVIDLAGDLILSGTASSSSVDNPVRRGEEREQPNSESSSADLSRDEEMKVKASKVQPTEERNQELEPMLDLSESVLLPESDDILEDDESISQQRDVCFQQAGQEQIVYSESLASALAGLTLDFKFARDRMHGSLSALKQKLQVFLSQILPELSVGLFVVFLLVDFIVLVVSYALQKSLAKSDEIGSRSSVKKQDETKMVGAVRKLQCLWRQHRRMLLERPNQQTKGVIDPTTNDFQSHECRTNTTRGVSTTDPVDPPTPDAVHPLSYSSRQLIHGLPALSRSLYQHRMAFHKLASTYLRQMTSLAFRNWRVKMVAIPKRIAESCNLNGLVDMRTKQPLSFACVAMALRLGNNSSHYLKITQGALSHPQRSDTESVQSVLEKLTKKTLNQPLRRAQDDTEMGEVAAARRIQRFWRVTRQGTSNAEDRNASGMSCLAVTQMRLSRKRTNRTARLTRRVSAA